MINDLQDEKCQIRSIRTKREKLKISTFPNSDVFAPLQMTFIGHQAQQVVLVLSDRQGSFLSPAQSVLLFQRCRLLLACLQHSNQLAQHLRCSFREEFRFYLLPLSYKIHFFLNLLGVFRCVLSSRSDPAMSFYGRRYFVKLPVAEAKLPPHYPISQPTLRLVQQILMLHR